MRTEVILKILRTKSSVHRKFGSVFGSEPNYPNIVFTAKKNNKNKFSSIFYLQQKIDLSYTKKETHNLM